ncbi:MAG TPA: methylated-DNA--[protein]-cysteine S-methyltransferase [Rubrivivax sp.]|jgi:methylated-DNA-[protein]-cysteine S-methyltransferase|nr:methylated-DNA--[protein]-cysteine S-methyltransferase [Rubrivivax sp.]
MSLVPINSRLVAQSQLATPLGPLTLAATQRGLALAWYDKQAHRTAEVAAPLCPQHPLLQQAAAQFDEYFAGKRREFDLPLDPLGTPFQQRVWQALLQIPMGRLSTYGQLARELGVPAAARAIGAAVGRNPICVVVPCHRVIGSNGSLTGYAAGLPRKESLLRLEGALLL